ncbi:SusC/RagA family TonB-linked outer membrane protein [Joostella sp.]|uniref:SusC/RagA family TonB-linked outer membrane protein n=1 Tax=Joostella sp. TaxID=2231138 RepID=UPI003A9183C1
MFKKLISKIVFVLLLISSVVSAQEKTVSGVVTDESNGAPLPGVSVVLKGTSNGVSTDFDGNFTMSGIPENGVLIFTYIGFKPIEVNISGRSEVNVSMVEDAQQLDEVVVTALGIKKETKALGYSLTEVDGDEMSTVKQTNAINSLQGKIAGVNITQNATGAGGSSRVVIRGPSTLTGYNQPLYVVDGIPISNQNNGEAGLFGGTDGGDGISSINPDDVESISVLKGGAASALYGSRAAGGVILITTKSGKKQKGFGVEFSSSINFFDVNSSIQDFQTEYGQGRFGEAPSNLEEAQDIGLSSWGAKLDGSNVIQWDGVARPYSYVGDNKSKFYRTGTTIVNTVSLSSSNENMNYRLSASDFDTQDIMPNSSINRKSFSLNAGAVLADKLSTQVNAKYSIEKANNRPRLSDAPGNANFTVANLPPNWDVTDMDPGTNPDGTERVFSNNVFSQNPYFAAYNFRNEDTRNRIIASTSLKYDIKDWIYLMGRVGTDHYTIRKTQVEPYGTAYRPLGAINEDETRYTQVDADIILGLEGDISEDFAVSALFGANSNSIKEEFLRQRGENFIVQDLEDVGNTANQSNDRTYEERKIGSLYGSLELSYRNFIYVTFTGRNDWFSTLSFPGKTTPNDDFYPSVNASVILSDAFNMGGAVNFLKLRGGYSEVAGGAQDPYQLALTYEIFGQGHLGQPLGRVNGDQVPNAGLVAFSKSELEIGLDSRFFNNRLSLDLAYYSNETTNDIVPVTASVFSGYKTAVENIGVLQNKGVEFLLSGTPIRTENFSWKTTINGAFNESKVVATNDVNGDISLGEPRTRNVEIKQIVDQPFGVIYGVSYVRDDSGAIVYDISDEGVPLARIGEREILGEGIPPWTFGFTNTFNYKGFSLNFLIDGKFGGQIFSGTNTVSYGNGLHKDTLEGRENGLEVSGIDGTTGQAFTTTVAPEDLQTYYGRVNDIAEHFVDDSDFIKFRQLSLGYSLPSSILEDTFINSLNFSIVGQDLFYIKRSVDNIDPESAYNVGNSQGLEYYGVPPTRTYGFNVNIKF